MKSNPMRALLLGGAMILTTVTGALAQQPEIKVLKTERSGNLTYLLFQVDNPSDRNLTAPDGVAYSLTTQHPYMRNGPPLTMSPRVGEPFNA